MKNILRRMPCGIAANTRRNGTKIISRTVATLAVACLAVSSLNLHAQTVTVSPSSGLVIIAKGDGHELQTGHFGAKWMHNQLPLTLQSSDYSTLSDNGLLNHHANNISSYSGFSDGITILGFNGTTNGENFSGGYLVLSLPQGYRFTNYKIVLTADIDGDVIASNISQTLNYPWATDNLFFSEETADGSTVTSSNAIQTVNVGKMGSNASATLKRSSTTANRMGNKLYFRYGTTGTGNHYSAMSMKLFDVSFECDNPFSVSVAPTVATLSGVDCAQSAFASGRTDIGHIEQLTNNGQTFFGYTYTNVKDLSAYCYLYDEGGLDSDKKPSTSAVTNGDIGSTEISDGTYAYTLKPNTYYVETPTEIDEVGNAVLPVGYRITGAKLNYYHDASSYETAGTSDMSFYITSGSGSSTTFLGTDGNWTTTDKCLWQMDDDGYISAASGSSTYYIGYSQSGSSYNRTYTLNTTNNKSDAKEFTKDSSGHIYFSVSSYFWDTSYYLNSSGRFSSSSSNRAIAKIYKNADYIINLYDKTGKTIEKTATVTSDNASGTLELTDLNNDAVKFSIVAPEGSTDAVGLVTVDLTLEGLDPYIEKMDVTCSVDASGEETTLTQQYVTTDFKIGSDDLIFYVPKNYKGDKVTLLFENMFKVSHDNTYYPDLKTETGYSRFNFVASDYYNEVGEDLRGNANIVADYDYTKKVNINKAGTTEFKFNNLKDLSSSSGYFTEYLFSLSDYTKAGGNFETVSLTLNSGDSNDESESKEFHLFVADETRYNISPATGLRHQYYAFYNGNIKIKAETYVADFDTHYTPIYTSTYHDNALDTDTYYGLKLAVRSVDDEGNAGEELTDGSGYLTVKQIIDEINSNISEGGSGVPKDAKHILYIDATNLYTVVSDTKKKNEVGELGDLRAILAPNALLYMPALMASDNDNTGHLVSDGLFEADNNIILQDQQPFFAPYEINIDAYNFARYERKYTANNGDETYATLMLPFSMEVTNGLYSDDDEKNELQFYSINSNFLSGGVNSTEENGYDYSSGKVNAHFKAMSGTLTQPNYPYLIEVVKGEGDMFTLKQYGAHIYATSYGDESVKRMTGESATATVDNSSVTFTQYGTYAGEELPRLGDYFYFATDKFYSSKNLSENYSYVNVRPFRTYFEYVGSSAAKIAKMDISLEPNDTPTGITTTLSDNAAGRMTVAAGTGCIVVKANADVKVGIHTVAGQSLSEFTLNGGEVRTVPASSGIYIVNGIKIVVR